MNRKKWWEDGVRFDCQGSGNCCVTHGSYGFVYVTLQDRRRLARHLRISTLAFTRRYCEKTDGHFHLKESPTSRDCMFLRDKRCGVYTARPTQCRTWPFWPDVMEPRRWRRDVASFCPGVGKGQLIPGSRLKRILDRQARSDG